MSASAHTANTAYITISNDFVNTKATLNTAIEMVRNGTRSVDETSVYPWSIIPIMP